ncbi:DUF3152 domain-containing protein [Nanchangia anserum]|uniref:DUF3152 domain-containing protein n=1 Tax=Nanchangia anserum TaxID=2692125 RepID=A0A8I0G8G9_9ACTO|nr:DUF3152 domain-containing protein [Nanchangia anserum]MBD3689807.1 DUF3152 domain-containing protein [Nanchangia anserum]QOX81978.1 DUF3152 domain-containing protein [Nanchangia anserum]
MSTSAHKTITCTPLPPRRETHRRTRAADQAWNARKRARARQARRQITFQLIAGAIAAALLLVIVIHALSGSTSAGHARSTTPSAAPATPTATPQVTSAPMTPVAKPPLEVTGDLPDDTTAPSVPEAAGTTTEVVPGTVAGREGGDVVTYRLEIEQGLPLNPEQTAQNIHAILNDPRGWGRNFTRTDGAADFRIVLASPHLVDSLCAPLATHGHSSCRNGTTVALNAMRWVEGADMWKQLNKTMTDYRIYMVNHEVGHFLGHGHLGCPSPGGPAPVMKQQSADGGNNSGCIPNGWITDYDRP